VPLAEFDGTPGDAVQQRCGARIGGGTAACQHGRSTPPGGNQAVAKLLHLRLFRAHQDDTERIEQHQLGVPANRLRDVVPACFGDEPRQFFDLLTHDGFSCVLKL
jgi:hypothetical protein